MACEIESGLGGRRQLARIESEVIRAFSGAAMLRRLQYLNHQVLLGEGSEIEIGVCSVYVFTVTSNKQNGARLMADGYFLDFRSSNPLAPASQCGLCGAFLNYRKPPEICGC